MSLFDDYWTFRVSGCDALVAAQPDSEGLFILNETAAWIWQHAKDPGLEAAYAQRYGIEREIATVDISQAFAHWRQHATLHPAKAPDVPFAVPPECPLIQQYKLEDTVIQVRYHSSALADEILPRVDGIRTDDPLPEHVIDLVGDGKSTSVIVDGICVSSEERVAGTRVVFLPELAKLAVPGRDFEAILHAGAVGDTTNCLVLAGQSFSGKSTLTAALMQSGLLCYSDDSAALTPDYQIAGLPFALSLREGSWHLFPHLDRPRFIPSNLGNKSPLARPVGVIFVNYDPEATTTTLTPVDRFQTLVELQQSGFWVRHTQSSIQRFLDWVSDLPSYRLTYSELPSAIAQVRRLLEA